MVVGAVPALGFHPRLVRHGARSASNWRGDGGIIDEENSNGRCRMLWRAAAMRSTGAAPSARMALITMGDRPSVLECPSCRRQASPAGDGYWCSWCGKAVTIRPHVLPNDGARTWFLLPQGKRRIGPLTASEVQAQSNPQASLQIRSASDSSWRSWPGCPECGHGLDFDRSSQAYGCPACRIHFLHLVAPVTAEVPLRGEPDPVPLPVAEESPRAVPASGRGVLQTLISRLFRMRPRLFEVPRTGGPHLCSDDDCPCSGTTALVPGKTGFVYISEDVVRNRRDLRTWEEAQAHWDDVARKLDANVHVTAGILVPILLCRRGATRRNLDLRVAARDAARWLRTGLLPLRQTPRA